MATYSSRITDTSQDLSQDLGDDQQYGTASNPSDLFLGRYGDVGAGEDIGVLEFADEEALAGATLGEDWILTLRASGMYVAEAVPKRLILHGALVPALAGWPADLTTVPLTAASVAWDVEEWTTGEDYTSPDLSSVIAEVAAQEGWDGSIGLVVVDDPADPVRNELQAVDFGTDAEGAALLEGTYTPSGDGPMIVELTGVSAGTSGTTGDVDLDIWLAVVSAGSSTTEGAVSFSTEQELTGVSAGSSQTQAGAMTLRLSLSGVSAGSSTTTGEVDMGSPRATPLQVLEFEADLALRLEFDTSLALRLELATRI